MAKRLTTMVLFYDENDDPREDWRDECYAAMKAIFAGPQWAINRDELVVWSEEVQATWPGSELNWGPIGAPGFALTVTFDPVEESAPAWSPSYSAAGEVTNKSSGIVCDQSDV